MTEATPDPNAAARLAELGQIAEGAKLLGAEGVFWRLCARWSPSQLTAFAVAEAQRGATFEDVMEGASVHIARQVAALARQTDQPLQVGAMLIEAISQQVLMELQPPKKLPGLHHPMGDGHG